MCGRFIDWLERSREPGWFERAREWDRGQSEVWPGFVQVGPDGLTLFQREAYAQLGSAIGPLELTKAGESEVYLTGKLPGTEATVSIYEDGAQVYLGAKADFIAEREDFARPQELIAKLVEAARKVTTR